MKNTVCSNLASLSGKIMPRKFFFAILIAVFATSAMAQIRFAPCFSYTPDVCPWKKRTTASFIYCDVVDIRFDILMRWIGFNVALIYDYSASPGTYAARATYSCNHDSPNWGFTCHMSGNEVGYYSRMEESSYLETRILGEPTARIQVLPKVDNGTTVCQKLDAVTNWRATAESRYKRR